MWRSVVVRSVHTKEHGSHTVQVVRPFWKGLFQARCSCGGAGEYRAEFFRADKDAMHHWQRMGATYD